MHTHFGLSDDLKVEIPVSIEGVERVAQISRRLEAGREHERAGHDAAPACVWEPALGQYARGRCTRGQCGVDRSLGEAGEGCHLRGEAKVDVAGARRDLVPLLPGAVYVVVNGALAPPPSSRPKSNNSLPKNVPATDAILRIIAWVGSGSPKRITY